MTHHLHFTFGPVQGFVAQARRTRDLYAGSLLLSHLAMAAMRGIPEAQKHIILPDFTELSMIEATSEHATAPNRFLAQFDSESAAASAGRAAQAALQDAWKRIANAVWHRFIEKQAAPQGHGTAAIWQRQITGFWNIAWVVTDKDDTSALDRRKNWQTHWPQEEGGDHCVLMGQWQELSGYLRSKQRDKQDAFWKAVSAAVSAGIPNLDLEPGERLCAIAFIKRFFPAVAEQAIGRKLDPRGWPSTVTLAAVPWLRKIAATPTAYSAAKAHADMAKDEPGAVVASAQRIKLLSDFPIPSLAKLSGNFLNRTALTNEDDTPLRPDTDRKSLLKSLQGLEDATADRAGNFYAVLLMDGDSMGALIRESGAQKVTTALTKFATAVPETISEHDGITIYAGGDDLLALLPLDKAREAATAVHQLYKRSFHPTKATVSAAIVFAHYRCTFSRVLSSAHELLDEVAKDKTGRDALAIRVLKPGGQTCEWSSPFEHFSKGSSGLFDPLVELFGQKKPLTASLLYNLRERFSQLIVGDEVTADRDQLLKLFTAEALSGKDITEERREETLAAMNHLVDACEVRRNPGNIATKRFAFDGPRLVKFLALDGKEGAE